MLRPVFLCALATALAACHRAEPPMPALFPESVGAWHRTSLRDLKAAEAPDPVPQAGIEKIQAASYEGPGKLDVRVYQMTASAVALDVVQRWRAAPDTIFFYADRFFVVVKWESAERKALQEFVAALEKKLNAKQ
jgi:hypothetical protein